MSHDILKKTKKTTNLTKSFLTILFYTFTIAEPLATLPQAYSIWVYKQTAGVSMLSWCGYLASSCIWFAYGIFKRDKILIISCFIWVITEGSVVFGLVIYR